MQTWDELVAHFQTVTDGLGKRIDEEIFETVVVLNALGIPTVQSCGGHLDQRGLLLPWVDIDPPDPSLEELRRQEEALVDAIKGYYKDIDKMRETGTSPEQIEEVRGQALALAPTLHSLQREMRRMQLEPRKKLMHYLSLFYKQRLVPFDRHLVLISKVRTRLQNQGTADFFITEPEAVQRQKLEEYQAEMREFTTFLKQLYFAQHASTPTPVG
uniref:Uncharacterized protein n=1 Tax=Thermosporothrix sp. COM3 TaxID=2490863 RepID=A0A455SKA1_9CHLR|nr:hypothetical protein KTC_28010 [Thermosporothrix sp. COM3]